MVREKYSGLGCGSFKVWDHTMSLGSLGIYLNTSLHLMSALFRWSRSQLFLMPNMLESSLDT